MSHPMLLGFVPAAALLIATSQVPKALGAPGVPPYDNEIARAGWVLWHPDRWAAPAVTVCGLTIAVVLLMRRFRPVFPAVLLCAVAATAVSAAGAPVGATVSEVPSGGFPPLTVDDLPWAQMPSLILAGAVIALVGFSESASIGRRFAAVDRTRWSADREFVSQGVANVAAGGLRRRHALRRFAVAHFAGPRRTAADPARRRRHRAHRPGVPVFRVGHRTPAAGGPGRGRHHSRPRTAALPAVVRPVAALGASGGHRVEHVRRHASRGAPDRPGGVVGRRDVAGRHPVAGAAARRGP